jgi:hypothetical protein
VICHYCGQDEDTRPYGPGGAEICAPCSVATPERVAQTEAAFCVQMDAAVAMSPMNGVILNMASGAPQPMMPGDLPPVLEAMIDVLRPEQGDGLDGDQG